MFYLMEKCLLCLQSTQLDRTRCKIWHVMSGRSLLSNMAHFFSLYLCPFVVAWTSGTVPVKLKPFWEKKNDDR